MDVSNLKSIIKETLLPLVSSYKKTVYLDLPFHTNLGDLLIWLGTEYFLKENSINCVYRNSVETSSKMDIHKDSLIFLHGGGNFGDVWRKHQEFRLQIVQKYINNRIIMFPQTVYYSDLELMKHDAKIFSLHKDLFLCARDQVSYNILKENFTNKVLLVPDMAFYIPQINFDKEILNKNETLYIRRVDGEINELYDSYIKSSNCEVADWPTIGSDYERFKKFYSESTFKKIMGIFYNYERNSIDRFILNWYIYNYLLNLNKRCNNKFEKFVNNWTSRRLLQSVLDIGINFLSRHKVVYSSRLHVCILCSIMDRSCVLIDNSYGKNYNFYKTWLQDDQNIKLFEK